MNSWRRIVLEETRLDLNNKLNGTAMGTNVGCMYTTIYYSYHKETRLLQLSYIRFYQRLIDDAFVAIRDDDSCYYSLLRHMNDFGPRGKRLEWEATKAGFFG